MLDSENQKLCTFHGVVYGLIDLTNCSVKIGCGRSLFPQSQDIFQDPYKQTEKQESCFAID